MCSYSATPLPVKKKKRKRGGKEIENFQRKNNVIFRLSSSHLPLGCLETSLSQHCLGTSAEVSAHSRYRNQHHLSMPSFYSCLYLLSAEKLVASVRCFFPAAASVTVQVMLRWGVRAGRRNSLKEPAGWLTKLAATAQLIWMGGNQLLKSKVQRYLPQGKALSVRAVYPQGTSVASFCPWYPLTLSGATRSCSTDRDTPWVRLCPAGFGGQHFLCPVRSHRTTGCWWVYLRSYYLWGQGLMFLFIISENRQRKHQKPQNVRSWRNSASVLGSSSKCIANWRQPALSLQA